MTIAFGYNITYHIIELNSRLGALQTTWLENNFGDGKDGRWLYRHPKLYFKNSKDHIFFTLRWS
jgi:hypothetical protein